MTDASASFPARRKLLKTTTISPDGVITVKLDFKNGATRFFVVPPDLLRNFAAIGAEHKLESQTNGKKTDDEVIKAIDDFIAEASQGKLVSRTRNGPAKGSSTLQRALMELKKWTAEQARDFLEGTASGKKLTQKDKMQLRRAPTLKPIIERLEAEDAEPTPDILKLLD